MNQRPPALSICIIVKNEAALLGRCIDSVREAADEIVVVDTGSTDESAEVARGRGARVIKTQWRDDFSWARNVSLDHAAGVWILWLDADDVVPAESIPKLRRLKQRDANRVYGLVVRNQKPGNTGSEFIQARMFPNDPRLRFEGAIHEQIMPSALRAGMRLEHTDIVVEHHGYADFEAMRAKARRNLGLLLDQFDTQGRQPVNAIEIADSYTILGEDDNALAWYRRVIDTPDTARLFPAIASQAWMGLGNIENRRGKHRQALRAFESARELCPSRPDVVFCLAVAREMCGDVNGAIEALRSLLVMKRSPVLVGVDFRETRIKTYLRLLRLYIERNQREALPELIEKAVHDCGDRPEIHNVAGAAWYRLGNLMRALHSFEKSIQVRIEGNIDAYVGLMMIYTKAGKRELAEKTYAKMTPAFGAHPRFLAMGTLLGLPDRAREAADHEAYEQELTHLRRLYDW
jgi:glycosyltransferase involved in cell wall biosynthesis